MKPGSKIIGLAVGQKSFLLAEVAPKGGRNAVQHFAEFTFPEGLSLATPDKLGASLGQFLKSRKFTTKDVVIGLPAKRLLTRRKDVPPASAEVAAASLRLQAEGEFSSELDNLVLDFAGTPSTSETTKVLLVATNRETLDNCEKMAVAAGLRVQAITSTTAALGRATSRLPGGDGWVLALADVGAEVVVQHGQDPAHMRHLNVNDSGSPESLGALAGEIRRMMASIPRNGTPQTLALWKGPSTNGEIPGNLLEQRLSMQVTTPEVRSLVATDSPEAEGYAPAVALALSALEPKGPPVDFLHSRLAPPPTPKISPQRKYTMLAITLLVLLIGGALYHLNMKDQEKSKLQSRIDAKVKDVTAAKAEKKRLDDAQKLMPKGPHFVNVLRDVSYLFPEQPNTVWATRLANAARDPGQWELAGKSINDQWPQTLTAEMLRNKELFSGARVTGLEQEANSQLYSFKIQFTYLGD